MDSNRCSITIGVMNECKVDGCDRPAERIGFCRAHYQRQWHGRDMDTPVRMVLRGVSVETRLRTYAPIGKPDECWNWTRSVSYQGYGAITAQGKKRPAHIVAWEIANGRTLPPGMVIRHTCDNPPCTNPAHLLLGTHGDNVADKVARGRQQRGEQHGNAVLTEGQVLEIRALYATGTITQAALAERFGVSQVGPIVRRETWKHI